jgi:hypothetical protein
MAICARTAKPHDTLTELWLGLVPANYIEEISGEVVVWNRGPIIIEFTGLLCNFSIGLFLSSATARALTN